MSSTAVSNSTATPTRTSLSHSLSIPGGPSDNVIKQIDPMLPHLKFYRKTVCRLVDECKNMPIGSHQNNDRNNQELTEILQRLYKLAHRLSTPGWALLLQVSQVRPELNNIRTQISTLRSKLAAATLPATPTPSPTPPTSNTTSIGAVNVDPIAEEEDETKEVELAQEKLKKYRSSADKLFGEYKIRPEDLKRFVLPKEHLIWNEKSTPLASDSISKIFDGEIVGGQHKGEKVHVKKLMPIEGGSTEDIIRRTIFLTHLLRSCENVVRPRFVVMPDLILLEPTSRVTLDKFDLPHQDKVDVAFKIASALALVHSFNIVHRDVRAANVVMTPTETMSKYIPKLTGFEVCRHMKYDYSLGSVTQRTVWHAPERVSWHGTSFKTDVFSFGVLMFEISMGKPPEMKGINVTQTDVQDWVSQEFGNISKEYSNLMRECLDIDWPTRPEMPDVVRKFEEITGLPELQSTSATADNNA